MRNVVRIPNGSISDRNDLFVAVTRWNCNHPRVASIHAITLTCCDLNPPPLPPPPPPDSDFARVFSDM